MIQSRSFTYRIFLCVEGLWSQFSMNRWENLTQQQKSTLIHTKIDIDIEIETDFDLPSQWWSTLGMIQGKIQPSMSSKHLSHWQTPYSWVCHNIQSFCLLALTWFVPPQLSSQQEIPNNDQRIMRFGHLGRYLKGKF